MGVNFKADINLNFKDLDALEIYNSDNDIYSLLLKITESKNLDFDQNQPKPGQSDSCNQPQAKVHALIIIEFAIHFSVLTYSSIVIYLKRSLKLKIEKQEILEKKYLNNQYI